MNRFFVTATGTEIGKTYVTAALVKAARDAGQTVAALKPVASGIDMDALAGSDPGLLLDAQGLPADPAHVERICPWHFAAPLSPDMAAAREGKAVRFDELVDFCRKSAAGPQDLVLIEGVGGIMAPLDQTHTGLDWAAALGCPVLLVAGTYLGTISHTLTALTSLATRAVPVAALVLNASPIQPVEATETAAAIARFAPALPIFHVSRQGDASDLYRALTLSASRVSSGGA